MPAIPAPPKLALPEGVSLSAPPPEPKSYAHSARFLRGVIQEYERRKCEALKIYTPLRASLDFHKSQAKTRLCLGSNRSSKTVTGSCETAWVATGTHPYRRVPKENGRIYIVGWDQEFIGKVLAPKLLHPGAFQIVRDEHTNKWRAVVPDADYDAANREKWRDAPPILPPRFVKSVNWESKKDNVPRDVVLTNGTVISYYSSKGEPQRGNEIDFAHIDEELENKAWPRELQRGLVKRNGSLIYTATPQSSSQWLFQAYRSAHAPEADKRLIESFHLHVKDNIYISDQARRDFYEQLQTDHDRRVCWDGEFALGEAVVYPEFTRERHVIPSREIPKDWSRWLVVDPGVTVCAVVFLAVPNPKNAKGDVTPFWHERHIYDELYLKRCSAAKFGDAVRDKCGEFASGGFAGFVIDGRMGRQSQMGSGRTVEFEYAEALRERGVWSRYTGSGFHRGSDDIKAREEALRGWFSPPYHDEPTPILRIHDRCKMLIWELQQQFYKQGPDGLVMHDQRVDKNNHATSGLEYLAEFNPAWAPLPGPKAPEDPILLAFRKKQAKQRQQNPSEGGVSLGPPA